jgi:hypothetical protein
LGGLALVTRNPGSKLDIRPWKDSGQVQAPRRECGFLEPLASRLKQWGRLGRLLRFPFLLMRNLSFQYLRLPALLGLAWRLLPEVPVAHPSSGCRAVQACPRDRPWHRGLVALVVAGDLVGAVDRLEAVFPEDLVVVPLAVVLPAAVAGAGSLAEGLVARPEEDSLAVVRPEVVVVAPRVAAVAVAPTGRVFRGFMVDLVVAIRLVAAAGAVVRLLLPHPLVAAVAFPGWCRRGPLWMISCCSTCLPGTANRLSCKCR